MGDLRAVSTDLVAVPGALYLLWVSERLDAESIDDWKSQPAAGKRLLPPRPPRWDRIPHEAVTR